MCYPAKTCCVSIRLFGILLALWGSVAFPARAEMSFAEEMMEFKRIGRTYQMAWEKAEQEPEAFVAIVREYPARAKWHKETVAKYRADIDAKSDRGKEVASAVKSSVIGIQTFMEHAGDFAKTFSTNYNMHLERARKEASEAEEKQLPGLYNAALNHLDRAEWMVTLLVAFNGDKDPNAQAYGKQVAALRNEFTTKEAALRKATARVVKVPVETYKGADLEELRKAVTAAWKTKYPKDEILRVVFDVPAWKLNRFSRWNDSMGQWDHIDKSFLPLTVIVRKDKKTALMHAAYVNRENRTNALNYGVDTKGSAFVSDEIPLPL
jgi:hypothetical protein